MSEYTCTITYPAGRRKIEWHPATPTESSPCHLGDHITFLSPDIMSQIHFGVNSPFEKASGPHLYTIPHGNHIKLAIANPHSDVYKFNCMPNGAIIENSGGEVPVQGSKR